MDWTATLAAVDFSSTVLFIAGLAALYAAVAVTIKGARIGLRFLGFSV